MFEKSAKLVFKKLKFTDKIELGLKITDNLKIKKLNKKYRQTDKATDVLSFPIDNPNKKEKYIIMLGDIVISRQFAEEHHEKLTDLFKHGLLHLLGFDHEKDKKRWDEIEKKILVIGA